MSGVYIKGMEIPTSGELLVIIAPNGEVRFKKSVASMWDRTTAVPVPDHGRLIDADVLRTDWLENGENEYVYDTNAILDSLDNAPTIIPAEEDTQKDGGQDDGA